MKKLNKLILYKLGFAFSKCWRLIALFIWFSNFLYFLIEESEEKFGDIVLFKFDIFFYIFYFYKKMYF